MVAGGEKWGIYMFLGEYHHSIDDKGRLIIPAKFRSELGDKFIITRGIENCLFAYPEKRWEEIVHKLESLPFTKKDARAFLRFFLSGATECQTDKQGRVALPTPLVNYANLKKECIVIGVNDRIEIWSSDTFDSYFDKNEQNISDLAEDLFDNMGD